MESSIPEGLLEDLLKKQKKIRFSGAGDSHKNGELE